MSKKEKKPKGERHHYIPQFYLRPWLGTDDKLEEFGRLPHSGQIRSRRRGTKSTGYEYDLYTIAGATEDTKQNIERTFMGTVDGSAAAARDLLLSGVFPTGELRHAWARFLMSIAMRTPDEIKEFKRRYATDWLKPDANFQARYEAVRKPGWPATLEEYTQQEDPTKLSVEP